MARLGGLMARLGRLMARLGGFFIRQEARSPVPFAFQAVAHKLQFLESQGFQ